MVEVGEIENLQVETLGTGFLPPLHRRPRLLADAGNGTLAQRRRLSSNRRCSPLELAFVGPDDGLQCG